MLPQRLTGEHREPRSVARRWRLAGLALCAAALVALAYGNVLLWLWRAWTTDPYFGHGLLVAPVAAFFAWRSRDAFMIDETQTPSALRLLATLPAALLYVGGIVYHETFLLAYSLVALLAGVAIVLLGIGRARAVAWPLGLLLFAIPPPGLVAVGATLQWIAVGSASVVMRAFGAPFEQDGLILSAGGATFEVAPLCSGLSGCISILFAGSVLAALSPLRPRGRALLVALAVPLVLLANAIRIALLVVVGARYGTGASEGILHATSDVVLFLLALAALIGIRAWMMTRVPQRRPADG